MTNAYAEIDTETGEFKEIRSGSMSDEQLESQQIPTERDLI